MSENVDYYLDITREVCPLTFVKAKLLVEKMNPGEVVEIRLKGAEPITNVPRSLAELGHEILAILAEPGEPEFGVHSLRVRKHQP